MKDGMHTRSSARGRDVAARDGYRFDGLVDGGGPNGMNLDAALSPDDSGDRPGNQDGLGGGSNFEHLFGCPGLARHT